MKTQRIWIAMNKDCKIYAYPEKPRRTQLKTYWYCENSVVLFQIFNIEKFLGYVPDNLMNEPVEVEMNLTTVK